MRIRPDVKQAWLVVKESISTRRLNSRSDAARQKARTAFDNVVTKPIHSELCDPVAIAVECEELSHNTALSYIFRCFWQTVLIYVGSTTWTLSEKGYRRLNASLQKALIDVSISDDISQLITNMDYESDLKRFGQLDKNAFYCILLEIIELWAIDSEPRNTVAFAWTLLDDIVDIAAYPPKFRLLKDIQCISDFKESDFVKLYVLSHSREHSMRKRLDWIETESLRPETYSRVWSRRGAINLHRNRRARDTVVIQSESISREVAKDKKRFQYCSLNPFEHDIYSPYKEGDDDLDLHSDGASSDDDEREDELQFGEPVNARPMDKWDKERDNVNNEGGTSRLCIHGVSQSDRSLGNLSLSDTLSHLSIGSPKKKISPIQNSGRKVNRSYSAPVTPLKSTLNDTSRYRRTRSDTYSGNASHTSERKLKDQAVLVGADDNGLLYHIVSKLKPATKPPVSPAKVLPVQQHGQPFVQNFVLDVDEDEVNKSAPTSLFSSPSRRQTRNKLYRHNSRGNFGSPNNFFKYRGRSQSS